MAKIELAHGKDAQVRKMAEKIVESQQKDIADMQQWLKNRMD